MAETDLVLAYSSLKAGTACLFFSFDEHDQINLERLFRSQLGRSGCDAQDRSLVVRHSTTIQPTVFAGHDERVGLPLFRVAWRDDVVVTVEQYPLFRRTAAVCFEYRKDNRVFGGFTGPLFSMSVDTHWRVRDESVPEKLVLPCREGQTSRIVHLVDNLRDAGSWQWS